MCRPGEACQADAAPTLDGNAIAGVLADVFGEEVTTATGTVFDRFGDGLSVQLT